MGRQSLDSLIEGIIGKAGTSGITLSRIQTILAGYERTYSLDYLRVFIKNHLTDVVWQNKATTPCRWYHVESVPRPVRFDTSSTDFELELNSKQKISIIDIKVLELQVKSILNTIETIKKGLE